MEKNATVQSAFERWKLQGIAVLVGDVDATVKHLVSLGITGPWGQTASTVIERKFHGKVTDYKFTYRKTPMGDVNLLLYQPLAGPASPYSEMMEKKGEGFFMIGFKVENLDEEVQKLTDNGARVIASGRRAGPGGFAYVDIGHGIIFELGQ